MQDAAIRLAGGCAVAEANGAARSRGPRDGRRREARAGDDVRRARRPFVLYVEGPGDSDILRSWARRYARDLDRAIEAAAVILGGRRPARALEHFRRERAARPALRGLCVLDRDDEAHAIPDEEPGLEFFTWPERHIESYLLVPDAIVRHARCEDGSDEIARMIDELGRGSRFRTRSGGVDAKRLLAPRGPLARELGRAISPAGIARAMRRDELHGDVVALLERVCDGVGVRARSEEVVVVRRAPAAAAYRADAKAADEADRRER
ncbi:MAG: hypothetical protein R3E88_00650 [Myxococcota bacterium]